MTATANTKELDLTAIQQTLREQKIDGWLFYDHHYRDPLAYRILGLGEGLHVTRRWFYFIPAEGEPKKLVHRIESGRLDTLPGSKSEYSSWQELEGQVGVLTSGATRIAMQYSPRNAIMYVSMVDAGTVEMVRALGKEVVSSADLVSRFEAVLNDDQIATHYVAQQKIDAVLEAGWQEIGRRVRSGGTHEFAMVEFLSEAMGREGLVWEHGPNVSVGANSADSHYEPTAASSKPMRKGDFVLIDIWGKLNRPDACYYDITWTGVVDREPTERERMIFETVRDARNAAIKVVRDAFAAGTPIAGWQADDAARGLIAKAGLAEWFTHRTGHNIGPVLHGNGANLDNLETHDERLILPKTCFSVEPGLYFPGEFGVRSEVDMMAMPERAEVTGRVQTELVRI
ncbi:Xaa-Pro peptidase family protein [Edaphobacter sp. 12200R-103]|jgi:Xaa-Pro dipeptidase|uniref:M24 family metallopeptidase n=1 Tax=Edaphobacter sp. 12200R-103 TaxID=2703788 RepID=UPI00138BD892|nr:Xaa-Pro peptidase family protein [Edaphobacter sp. 12200R-103]QHS53508.1 aminopeptidase P family protein [Edaphobacter sp. 12200R-103]